MFLAIVIGIVQVGLPLSGVQTSYALAVGLWALFAIILMHAFIVSPIFRGRLAPRIAVLVAIPTAVCFAVHPQLTELKRATSNVNVAAEAARAYVSLYFIDPESQINPRSIVRTVFRNSGSTPAKETMIDTGTAVLDGKFPDRPFDGRTNRDKREALTLSAGGIMGQHLAFNDFTEDELKRVRENRDYSRLIGPRLFFFGVIRYKDVFGQQHENRFCMFWRPQAWITCEAHNYDR